MMINAFDSGAPDTHALVAAQAKFDDLRQFIESLHTGMPERMSQVDQLTDATDALKYVATTFGLVADTYFERAKALIPQARIAPFARSAKFQDALDRLQEHALLFANLIRTHPVKIFSSERRLLLMKLLELIASRLIAGGPSNEADAAKPQLIPIIAPVFKYVLFRYVDNFALIGVLPQIAPDDADNQNLSVLWHEVAGHATTTLIREQKNLVEGWVDALAKALQANWDTYFTLYSQSVLENLYEKEALEAAEVLDDLKTLYRQQVLILDEKQWQIAWLTEFLEDLFWVMVLEGEGDDVEDATIKALANALAAYYPDPTIGDVYHPPLNLRLLVGIAYLSYGDPKKMETMISNFGDEEADPLQLRQANRGLAMAIADFCREDIIHPQDGPGVLYRTTVSETEKTLAKIIIGLTPEALAGFSAALAAPGKILPKSNTEFLASLEKINDLQKLLSLSFTDTDLIAGQSVSPPPPFRP